MVDRDLIVERQPFHDEVTECSEVLSTGGARPDSAEWQVWPNALI
jgi:hypothetical protein